MSADRHIARALARLGDLEPGRLADHAELLVADRLRRLALRQLGECELARASDPGLGAL